MLNDEKINQLIKSKAGEDFARGYWFYGVIIKKPIYESWIAVVINEYYLVSITEKRIHLYRLGLIGESVHFTAIPMQDAKEIKVSNWMFGFGKRINIRLGDGQTIKLKAANRPIGIKEQEFNLLKLEQLYGKSDYKFK